MRNDSVGRIFSHNELYFASPEKFNDPFDCKNNVSVKGVTREDLERHYRNVYKARQPSIPEPAFVDKQVELALRDPNFQEKINNAGSAANEESKKLGILCLSKPHRDILLWSHYANKHQGIALQFDEDGLSKWISESHGWLEKVDYKDNMPTLKELNMARYELLKPESNPLEIAKLLVLRKATHWEYEGEYRAIMFPENKDQITYGYYNFPSEIFTGVILESIPIFVEI